MNLYEFEGKALLARLGIRTPRGVFCRNVAEAQAAADTVGYPCVVKSQVLTGGRGKAGGVVVVPGPDALPAEAARILGLPIQGETPVGVLIEEKLPGGHELYAAVAFDTSQACPVLLFSPRGGMEVESDTSALLRIPVALDELAAVTPAWINTRLRAGLAGPDRPSLPLLEAAGRLLANLLSAFREHDLELVEINPLIVTGDEVTAADAKVTVDDDALFRQTGLTLTERPPLGELEIRAKQASLQFVDLDGEICLMANGAGLNLALLDAVGAFGSSPADFLDTGGGASTAKTYEAMRILQDRGRRDPKVRAHLVMLSLAITRAREAAEGIARAVAEQPDDPVPTFAVVHGTGADEGRRILHEVGITVAPDIRTAVEWATQAERRA